MAMNGNSRIIDADSLLVIHEDLNVNDPSDGSSKQPDGSSLRYRRPVAQIASADWDLGWTDGRLAQSPQIRKDMLTAAVKLEIGREVAHQREDLAAKKGVLTRLHQQLSALSQERLSLRPVFERIRSERFDNALGFSMLLGSVLLLIAIAIWLADISLSANLVTRGFHMFPEVNCGDKCISLDHIWVLDDLFGHPREVLKYLWQPLLFALGLAFSPVIIKLLFEELFSREHGQERISKRRLVVCCIAVIILLGALGTLAVFRTLSYNQIANRQSALPINLSSDEPADTSNQSVDLSNPGLTITSFLLLSLMLSISGALLFYSGWTRLSRGWEYYRLKFKVGLTELKHAWRTKKAVRIENLIGHLDQQLIPQLLSPEYEQACIYSRLKAYQHGYERGYQVPSTLRGDEGIYMRCKGTVLRKLAGKTNYF
ncbi:MAG TPA: hypothetical protein VHA33_06585 [Candidatus Angelobacter sp.]|jgi:hypothetical protein|nr:hypothetical protein [Candidatus Angelobacter sp.]